ncbi:MAG TPA: hydroxymethylbilane synthase [Chitinispirillaceae bacterium]|nr:hydroxymethylbilane synthase [Chitinispirillaceae bacterium]
MQRKMFVGTRGSRLALAQTEIVIERFKKVEPSLHIEVKIISTTGDKDQKTSLKDIGGKGVFIKEIEHALLNKNIDIAVHSFKDITSQTAEGLSLSGFLKPESVCDVLISHSKITLRQIPAGSTIGTGSMRRRALLKRMRNDLKYIDIRGNIDTRISRVDEGVYAGIVLSEAGVIRLGLTDKISERFNPELFIPAPGQGVIAVETRAEDIELSRLCREACDEEQYLISSAEFSVLESLGFDCRMPFGMHSRVDSEILTMKAFYENQENGSFVEEMIAGSSARPLETGKQLADQLLKRLRLR